YNEERFPLPLLWRGWGGGFGILLLPQPISQSSFFEILAGLLSNQSSLTLVTNVLHTQKFAYSIGSFFCELPDDLHVLILRLRFRHLPKPFPKPDTSLLQFRLNTSIGILIKFFVVLQAKKRSIVLL